MSNLENAARAVIYQRDHMAEYGKYDRTRPNPDAQPDQCFDDWGADILETALVADGLKPYSFGDPE